METISGKWDIGFLQDSGTVIDDRRVIIGSWSVSEDVNVTIKLYPPIGPITYVGIFDGTDTITGKYYNFKYKWIAQIEDPYAKSEEGSWEMTRDES
jgi:hypothetical protein